MPSESTAAALEFGALSAPRTGRRVRMGRFARRQPVLLLAVFVLFVMAAAAALAPAIAPYSPTEHHLSDGLVSPNSTFLLGTDQYGRDILSRTMYAGRVSLVVGFGVMILGGLLAALLGGLSGYAGGWLDALIQRTVDAFLSVPTLLLLMTVLSVIGASVSKMVIVIAVLFMISSSRITRSAVLVIKAQQYVEAARSTGAGPIRILLRYVLPNAAAPIIVVSSLIFGYAILVEAALGFLGFGVPPPTVTWGGMLAGDSRTFIITAPWIAIAPGVALTVVVLAVNLLGDSLRDILDPRLKGIG